MPKPAFKRFGKYEIQAQLGRGGFGTVFRAFDPTVGRLVALKVLMSEARSDLLTRFRNEATAAGNLRHENIVTIYDFGEDNGLPYIAMEYLEGEDLQQAMASGRPLTLLDKVSIMTQAAAGLDCAHRHGVVHRDVKPANIRLLPDGSVKIMDFGIARLTRDSTAARLTRRGHVLGTLLYMAPEQVMGSETDALCDIFAYGVTFYELLAGRHPFQAEDPRSVFYKITSEDPELIHHLLPNCPETLDHVIRRALHKDRELRYQTLRDLRVDVEPVLTALRRERAAALVAEAEGFVGSKEFDRALSLLHEAIDFDAANQKARQLRDSAQAELRRRLVRPRVEALLAKADQSLAEGNYNDAVQTLESAVRLDPEDEGLQARVREVQLEREQNRESNRLLKEARADLAEGSLAAALHKASEAIALNHKNADARSLIEIVQLEMGKRDRQLRLNDKLRQAREFLLLNSFSEALAVIEALEPEERNTPAAVELLGRVQAQKAEYDRQERLRSELANARELLDRARFVEAVQLLQRMRSEFPGEGRIAGLLSYAQQELSALERAQAIEKLQGEVLTCAEEKRFEEAIALLTSAMSQYPGESGILRLRDTVLLARSGWERKQALEQTVRDCEALADQDQFDEAIATLRDTLRRYPDDATLHALQGRLETDRERYRKEKFVLDALRSGGRLGTEGRPEAAVAELEAALAQVPDERLRQALAGAREAATAKRRALLRERLEQDVRTHLDRHEFDRALHVVDRASASLLGDPLLAQLQEAALSAKAAWEQEEAIAAAERTAKTLRQEQRLDEALDIVAACRARFPTSAILTRLEGDLREERERRNRELAIRAQLEHAESLSGEGDYAGAVELLHRAAAQFPGEPALSAELTRAEELLHKRQRDQAVAAAREQARELVRSQDFDRALAVIAAAAASWPGQPEMEDLRHEVLTLQAANRREREIAAVAQRARTLCAEERFAEAVEVAGNALAAYPGETELQGARAAAQEELEKLERAENIRRAIQGAEKHLSAGHSKRAAELLEDAKKRYGEDAAVDSLLARAEQALQSEMREAAIVSAVTRAESLIDNGRPEEAVSFLEKASREQGDSPELAAAHRRAEESIAARARSEALAKTILSVRVRIDADDHEGALAELESATHDFPNEPQIEALRTEIVARQTKERQRSAEIEKCVADAAEFSAADEPGMAVELLSGAITRLGLDPRLRSALSDAETALKTGRRLAEIADAIQRAGAEAAQNRIAEALAILQRAEQEFGADAAIDRARAPLLAAQREREAEAERGLAAQREQQDALHRLLQQCSDLIAAGNLTEAGRKLQQALRDFPDQPDLLALQQRLRSEWDLRRRSEATRRAVDNARRLLDQGHPARAVQLLEAAAAQYPDDPLVRDALAGARETVGEKRKAEVDSVCRETRIFLDKKDFDQALKTVELNLETLRGDPRLVELRQSVIAARRDHQQQATRAVTEDSLISQPTREVRVAPDVPPPPPPVRRSAQPPRSQRPRLPKAALIVAGSALAATGIWMGTRGMRTGGTVTRLEVETQPAGASVKIGERSCVTPDCRVDLPAGSYRVDAHLPGYAPATQDITVQQRETAHVQIALQPLPASVLVKSNFSQGTVSIDDKPAGQLQDGQLALSAPTSGTHRLRIDSPDGEASLTFRTGQAQLPEVIGAVSTRNTGAIVVSTLGAKVQASCSGCQGTLLLDGKPLEGTSVAEGVHELTTREEKGQAQRASFRTDDAPVLAVHLSSTVSAAGTLVVETNVDGATVFVDRRKLARQTEAGRLVAPLDPHEYRIEVHKSGYRVSPERLVAKIQKGEQFRAVFRLEALPTSISLSGLPDGATVVIDGAPSGTARGGAFSTTVAAGVHSITLSKEGWKAGVVQRSFEPGETARLDSASLHVEQLPQSKPAAAPPVERPQPAPRPAQPTAEEVEAGDWASARAGRDPASLQAFLQKHPDSSHRQEAQQLLAQMEWDALDKNDRGALDRFASQHRGNPLAQQAAGEIARLDREAAAVSRSTAEQRLTADRSEIVRVLSIYSTAFDKKDLALLKSIWPSLPEAGLAPAFRGKEQIHSQLRPQTPAEVNGDNATVRCIRVTEQVTQFGRKKPVEEPRTVHFHRENGRWVISAID